MKNKKQTTLAALMLAAGIIITGTTQASAQTTRTVDDDGRQCPTSTFTTIQAAVNASVAGDTVQVCQGRYPEQVVINKSITVRGISAANTSRPEIQTPTNGFGTPATSPGGSPISAMILVQNTTNARILNLTVNGQNRGNGGSRLVGIYYSNASGTILNNAIKNINTTPVGQSTSTGIFVGNTDSANRTVTISNNVIVNYEKNGIVANEVGTNVTISGNSIFGAGFESPQGVSQNGVQIGFGAVANINTNRIGDNFFTSCRTAATCSDASVNVLIIDALANGVYQVNDNNLSKGNYNIAVFGASIGAGSINGSSFSRNQINSTVALDAIFIDGSNNTIDQNRIFNTDQAAVNLNSGTGNSVTRNTLNDALFGVNRQDTGNNQSANVFINVDTNVNPGPPQIFGAETGRASKQKTAQTETVKAAPANVSAIR